MGMGMGMTKTSGAWTVKGIVEVPVEEIFKRKMRIAALLGAGEAKPSSYPSRRVLLLRASQKLPECKIAGYFEIDKHKMANSEDH